MTSSDHFFFLFLLSLNTRDLWSQFEEASESSEKVDALAQRKKVTLF